MVIENALWDLPAGGLGQYLGSVAFIIGVTSMGFLVPALAGYIAFAIADRPGIAPGFVAGAVAVLMNAGFIGGIVGGLLAGLVGVVARTPARTALAAGSDAGRDHPARSRRSSLRVCCSCSSAVRSRRSWSG